MKQISTVKQDNRTLHVQWRHWQARRNVFVSGGTNLYEPYTMLWLKPFA